jgi:hypothetical protein
LRPLRVALDRLWCNHDYPRWGGHSTLCHICTTQSPPCSSYRLLSIGSELSSLLGSGPSLLPRPMQQVSYVRTKRGLWLCVHKTPIIPTERIMAPPRVGPPDRGVAREWGGR